MEYYTVTSKTSIMNIRTYMIVLGLLLTSAITKAQETKTLLGHWKPMKKVKTVGLYVAPEMGAGQINGEFRPMAGMSAMAILNKKWSAGVTTYGTKGRKNNNSNAVFGGLKLAYTLMPNRLIHVSFPLVLGMAGSFDRSIDQRNQNFGFDPRNMQGGRNFNNNQLGGFNNNQRGDHNQNAYMLIQPGLHTELNLFKYGKVFVGANYRLAMGEGHGDSQTATLSASQLSGFSVNSGIKLGVFDFKVKKGHHKGQTDRDENNRRHRE